MEITTKIKMEVITKEDVGEMTDEEIKQGAERIKQDLVRELGLEEDSMISSYNIDIEVEKNN